MFRFVQNLPLLNTTEIKQLRPQHLSVVLISDYAPTLFSILKVI
ncbi:unnamed protein product [Tenebrio molitor]|nr:unnamed protein product [Tenebrio molitor]